MIQIQLPEIAPDITGVLATQGIPPGTPPPDRVKALYDDAEKIFTNLALPAGIMADIGIEEFAEIYPASGQNEPDTPLEHIFPKAKNLALAAFTLGPEVSREIEEQLKSTGFALGYMLDAIASYSADRASVVLQGIFHRRLREQGQAEENDSVLMYSPGYCGWHIGGQQPLFQYLQPETIGIRLNASFLMTPLKSISGVLVSGPREIHQFINHYPFCSQCRSKNCRDRIKSV